LGICKKKSNKRLEFLKILENNKSFQGLDSQDYVVVWENFLPIFLALREERMKNRYALFFLKQAVELKVRICSTTISPNYQTNTGSKTV